MSDRRRIIAALRAKADSTTFPAEAETLRTKADDLEAKLRAGERRSYAGQGRTVRDVQAEFARRRRQAENPWHGIRVNVPGHSFYGGPTYSEPQRNTSPDDWRVKASGLFDAMGGVRPGESFEEKVANTPEDWMTVTDINGRTHRERIY